MRKRQEKKRTIKIAELENLCATFGSGQDHFRAVNLGKVLGEQVLPEQLTDPGLNPEDGAIG